MERVREVAISERKTKVKQLPSCIVKKRIDGTLFSRDARSLYHLRSITTPSIPRRRDIYSVDGVEEFESQSRRILDPANDVAQMLLFDWCES